MQGNLGVSVTRVGRGVVVFLRLFCDLKIFCDVKTTNMGKIVKDFVFID